VVRGPTGALQPWSCQIPFAIVGALMNGDPRPDVHIHVARFLGNEFDPRIDRMTIAQHPILPLRDGVRVMDGIKRDEIDALADQTLALPSGDVAQHIDFFDLRQRLAVGIIALKFGADRFPGLLRAFAELYNLLDLFRDAPGFDAPKFRGVERKSGTCKAHCTTGRAFSASAPPGRRGHAGRRHLTRRPVSPLQWP
jgi:hypothetical protein